MVKKGLWYSLLAIAIAGLIVFSIGFYQALNVTSDNNTIKPAKTIVAPVTKNSSKLAVKNSNSIQILILGDSIAKGTGDENNKGFSGYLTESLKNITSKEILTKNEGIDGLESGGLLNQLQSNKLNNEMAAADYILISIGGNDLKSIITLNDLSKKDSFKGKMSNYLNSLNQTLKILKTINPNSHIIFLGLYNPFDSISTPEDIQLLNEWNYNTQQLIEADSKAIYVPTYDLMKYNLAKYLAKDGLHPSSAGYKAISDRISKSLESIITG